jgi:hypothetical protein
MKCDEGSTECAEEEMELKGKDEISQRILDAQDERNSPIYYYDEYATITTEGNIQHFM